MVSIDQPARADPVEMSKQAIAARMVWVDIVLILGEKKAGVNQTLSQDRPLGGDRFYE